MTGATHLSLDVISKVNIMSKENPLEIMKMARPSAPERDNSKSEQVDFSQRFQCLSPLVQTELRKIMNNLPEELVKKILKREKTSDSPKESFKRKASLFAGMEEATIEEVAEEWEEEAKQNRKMEGKYTRCDVEGLDEAAGEDATYGVLRRLLYRGENGLSDIDLLKASNEVEFRKLLIPFLDSVWANRGKEKKIVHSGDAEKARASSGLAEASKKLKSIEDTLKKMEDKHGRKKRSSGEVLERLANLREEKYTLEEIIKENRGNLNRCAEAEKTYDALVFLTERLSSEYFAVIVLESLDAMLNALSRRTPKVEPELLIYLERAVSDWAQRHKGETALLPWKNLQVDKKIAFLIKQFSARLASFERHGKGAAISQEMKDGNEFEILTTARLIERFAHQMNHVGRRF